MIDEDVQHYFRQLNELPEPPGWEKRVAIITQLFPSVVSLNWIKAMNVDPEHIFGALMHEVHRQDARQPGSTGRSTTPDLATAMMRHRQFAGDDYAMLPFPQAFQALAGWQPSGRRGGPRGGRMGVTGIARKVGLDRAATHRLLTGIVKPSVAAMTAVAAAYGKHPSYFKEFRSLVLLRAMTICFDQAPETSVDFYRAVARAG